MPTEFVAENTTGRSGAATESPERQMITLNGTRLYPGKTYRFDDFTSDVLKAMRDGLIQVQRSNGVVVSFEDLQEDYEIKSGTRTANVPTGNGGTRRVQHEYLELREKEEAQDEEVADEEAGRSGSDVPAEESEEVEEGVTEDEPEGSLEETEEEASEEDASTETEEELAFVEKLVESGEVTEDDLLSTVSMDEINSSSDLKASSAADILGDIDNIPESFVEEESRSTVTDVL